MILNKIELVIARNKTMWQSRLNKRGAMFGLDARIALAIFGALSVISGAALYSAIQNAKVTALLARLNEAAKGYEQYYLDVGSHLIQSTTDSSNDGFYILKAVDLIEIPSGAAANYWQGPYLQYKINTSNNISLLDSEYTNLHFLILSNDDSWDDSIGWANGICTTGKICDVYVHLNGVDDLDMIKKIDIKVDGEYDSSKGRFRVSNYTSSPQTYAISLKIMPIENPND